MMLSLARVAHVLGCVPLALPGDVGGWSIDSRSLEAGDLFIALRGGNHDGHAFVNDILARGAVAAVVDRQMPGPTLCVPDTQLALEQLGRQARLDWGGTVIGVTGSAGKTTAKDNIAALLAVDHAVGKTVGNLNNHIGVPLSILRLPAAAKIAVLEMGMNHAGEIRHLCSIARPEIGVITNVGHAHLENFADGIDGVAAAKRELIEALPAPGLAVLNYDDRRVRMFPHAHTLTYGLQEGAQVRGEEVELQAGGSAFSVEGTRFQTSHAGRHAILNILAAIAVARELGTATPKLVDAVRGLTIGTMRGERLTHNGVVLINDAYNSNPAAARAMLDVLRATPGRRRIAVLGEMLELGPLAEPLHRDVGEYAAKSGIDVLIGIRGAARHLVDGATAAGLNAGAAYFFPDAVAAGQALRSIAQSGDVVLFKGSRGTRVENALSAFVEDVS